MTRFKTLMRREWMQHHRGWLIMLLAPPTLFLVVLLLPMATVQVGPMRPIELMLAASLAVPVVLLGIAVASILIQAPGLARRDRQDRSIEFWLSMPTSHAQSVGATVLMQALVVPLLAVAAGWLLSQPIALALVTRAFGFEAWTGLPWGALIPAGLAALLRAALGVVLASLWLLPMLLLTMAASAWLKRWGVPVLGIVLWLGHTLLAYFYGITLIGDTIDSLWAHARQALVHDLPMQGETHSREMILGWLHDAPAWLAHDALASIADLAQPLFLVALLASALCFGLLVLRRARNG